MINCNDTPGIGKEMIQDKEVGGLKILMRFKRHDVGIRHYVLNGQRSYQVVWKYSDFKDGVVPRCLDCELKV